MRSASPLANPVAAAGWALLLLGIAGAVALGLRARRRGASRRLAVAAAVDLLVGLLSAVLGLGHLAGVVGGALRASAFRWDFRFAALLIVGIFVTGAGLMCALAARRLASGAAGGWGRARDGALLLLAVNAPLLPVQGFALALAILAALDLALLMAARRSD